MIKLVNKVLMSSFLIVVLCCEGPEGSVGPEGLISLLNISTELAGTNCPNGGVKIGSGIDSDSNGTLDTNEITSTVYVCNGSGSLIKTSAEAAGANCTNGGLRVESGLDNNGNDTLDGNEISETSFICNDFSTYIAQVEQSGTDAPSSTIIENALNLSITWTRESQGKFNGTLDMNLDLSKSIIICNNNSVTCKFTGTNTVRLENVCGVNAFCDDFDGLNIEIRQYE